MKEAEQEEQREMRAGDRAGRIVLDDELTLRKDAVMRDEFLGRVGQLGGIDRGADGGYAGVVALGHEAEGIARGQVAFSGGGHALECTAPARCIARRRGAAARSPRVSPCGTCHYASFSDLETDPIRRGRAEVRQAEAARLPFGEPAPYPQRRTVTRKKVAGIEVLPSLFVLCAFASSNN